MKKKKTRKTNLKWLFLVVDHSFFVIPSAFFFRFFFFNDTATTEIYTLSLHDALPIRLDDLDVICAVLGCEPGDLLVRDPSAGTAADRKSTRLNSRHPSISYAVFC